MPRGQASPVGTIMENKNGYKQIKTENDGWIGLHVHIMQEHLGRKLGWGERVRFKDGNKSNCDLSNLEIALTQTGTQEKKIAGLRARIADLQDILAYEEEILAKAQEKAQRPK